MDAQLSPADLAIVFAYVLAMTLFGVAFSRKQKDLKAYFVGDRNVGWFLVLISIVATETSAVTFLSVPGTAYNPAGGNFTFLQLSFGYVLGRCLVAWLLLPLYMRGELFTAYLSRFGYRVIAAANGIEAMSLYPSRVAEIALVVTDLGMPEMGGAELASVLTRLNPKVKIIFMSGADGSDAQSSSLPSTARILRKPFVGESLLSVVNEMLHGDPR